MSKNSTNSFSLEGLFRKRGISLYHADGIERSPIDIIEDLYIRLNQRELSTLFYEIGEEEDLGNNIFQREREQNEN